MGRPDFLILGAQKAGTTSLYAALSAHPRVRAARTKEVHYFDLNHARGDAWYATHFPSAHGCLVGEATPYYLFHPRVPARVAAYDATLKLIVLLRHPIDRALSHHAHARRQGLETLDAIDALRVEDDRTRDAFERLQEGRTEKSDAVQHHSYLARGHYAAQLSRWLEHFERDQLLVLQADALFADAAPGLARVAHFLGLDAFSSAVYPALNRAEAPVDAELRARVMDEFAHRFASEPAELERLGVSVDWPDLR